MNEKILLEKLMTTFYINDKHHVEWGSVYGVSIADLLGDEMEKELAKYLPDCNKDEYFTMYSRFMRKIGKRKDKDPILKIVWSMFKKISEKRNNQYEGIDDEYI